MCKRGKKLFGLISNKKCEDKLRKQNIDETWNENVTFHICFLLSDKELRSYYNNKYSDWSL